MAAPCPNPLPLKLISGGDNKLGAFTTILAGEFGGVINLGLNCGKSSGGAFGEKAGAALFTFLGTIPALTSISALGSDTIAKFVVPFFIFEVFA